MDTKELTDQQIADFDGLQESYADMERRLVDAAPMCHMRKMFFDECDGVAWWECSHCGHTKKVWELG